MKNVTAVFLTAVLLLTLAGCASRPQDQSQGPSAQEAATLADFYAAQTLRNILSLHENVTENVVFYDARGNPSESTFRYADKETSVFENSWSYVLIQHEDGYYEYDPDTMEHVAVAFGMEGTMEADWSDLQNAPFEFLPSEREELLSLAETDGRLCLTTADPANAEDYPEFAGQIQQGDRVVVEIEADPETYMVHRGASYIEKQDGTKLPLIDFSFSYDGGPYEPSGEMRQVIDGDYRTITVIADPGTEKETSYTKSCGENGAFTFHLAEGYENIYLDADCTQKSAPSREPGERTVYIAEGK